MNVDLDTNADRVEGAVVQQQPQRRWGRVAFWAVLILIGPGVWVASYWHEFFIDGSVYDERWLCVTITSGGITMSYNSNDWPPSPPGGLIATDPFLVRQVALTPRRISIMQFRAAIQSQRRFLTQWLEAEGSSEESTRTIASRLDELNAYVADQEKENAALLAEDRKQGSRLLNDALSQKLWFLERNSAMTAGYIVHVNLLVPPALLVVVALIYRHIRRRRRRRREREGYCDTCGYNLAGNVSGVCPECGRAAPATVRHATSAQQA